MTGPFGARKWSPRGRPRWDASRRSVPPCSADAGSGSPPGGGVPPAWRGPYHGALPGIGLNVSREPCGSPYSRADDRATTKKPRTGEYGAQGRPLRPGRFIEERSAHRPSWLIVDVSASLRVRAPRGAHKRPDRASAGPRRSLANRGDPQRRPRRTGPGQATASRPDLPPPTGVPRHWPRVCACPLVATPATSRRTSA